MTVDGIHALPRPHPPPAPNTCQLPTDASAYRYNDPQGGFTTELVPIIESFDDKLQQVDRSGKLQVRFAELGTLEKIYHCGFNGTEIDLGAVSVFGELSGQ